MLRLLLALLAAPLAATQPASVAPPGAPDSLARRSPDVVYEMGGSLLLPSDGFARELGGVRGGARASFGVRPTPNVMIGIDGAIYAVSRIEEDVPGAGAAVWTETTLGKVGAFGRYGRSVGPVRVYAEGLAAVSVLSTTTGLTHAPPDAPTQLVQMDAAPGLGVGVSVEVAVLSGVAVHVRGGAFRGAPARYLVRDGGTLTERTSDTSAASVTVGLSYAVPLLR